MVCIRNRMWYQRREWCQSDQSQHQRKESTVGDTDNTVSSTTLDEDVLISTVGTEDGNRSSSCECCIKLGDASVKIFVNRAEDDKTGLSSNSTDGAVARTVSKNNRLAELEVDCGRTDGCGRTQGSGRCRVMVSITQTSNHSGSTGRLRNRPR